MESLAHINTFGLVDVLFIYDSAILSAKSPMHLCLRWRSICGMQFCTAHTWDWPSSGTPLPFDYSTSSHALCFVKPFTICCSVLNIYLVWGQCHITGTDCKVNGYHSIDTFWLKCQPSPCVFKKFRSWKISYFTLEISENLFSELSVYHRRNIVGSVYVSIYI